MDRQGWLKHFNWPVFISVIILCVIGLANIYATQPLSDHQRITEFLANPITLESIRTLQNVHVVKQGLYMVLGLVVLAALYFPSYEWLGKYSYWIYAAGLGLLVLVLLLPPIRNSHRWIRLFGFQLQASEVAKIGFVLALARYLRFRRNYRDVKGLVGPLLMALVPMGLVVIEPDLGSSLLFLPVLFAVLFMAGARVRHLMAAFLLGVLALPVMWFLMRDYQRNRIRAVIYQSRDDSAWKNREGYQLARSKLAVGAGGMTGQGYRESPIIRLGRLPEDHTDLIFAAIANQWGFTGAIIVLILYMIIFALGLEVATVTNEPFGRLVAVGIVAMIAAQMLINVAMTVGLGPITGMGLPFVSYGGSSLLTNFIGIALLLNISHRRPLKLSRKPFEFND
jgi:rod shape-determining protein RodA